MLQSYTESQSYLFLLITVMLLDNYGFSVSKSLITGTVPTGPLFMKFKQLGVVSIDVLCVFVAHDQLLRSCSCLEQYHNWPKTLACFVQHKPFTYVVIILVCVCCFSSLTGRKKTAIGLSELKIFILFNRSYEVCIIKLFRLWIFHVKMTLEGMWHTKKELE